MLAELAIVPSAPLLVPELSGSGAVEAAEVRRAVVDVAHALGSTARRWIAVGLDGPARRFSAFGADVPVAATSDGGDARMPLSMLIACWCRGQAPSPVDLDPVVVDAGFTSAEAHRVGVDLGARVDADPAPIGVLVVADGPTMLSPSAPGGGERQSAHRLQAAVDDAIGSGRAAELGVLDASACESDGVVSRPVFEVMAGLWGPERADAEVLYRGAPFGVGYTVATWRPAGARP